MKMIYNQALNGKTELKGNFNRNTHEEAFIDQARSSRNLISQRA
jgi:hypothetical protein